MWQKTIRALCVACLLASSALAAAQTQAAYKYLYRQAQDLERAGSVEQALELYRQAAAQSRADSPADAGAILFWMGTVYEKQRRYAEAEQAYLESLQLREQALGPEDGAVAASLNNLAGLYVALGDYPRAQPLYERALGIDEKQSGAEDPKVAIRLNNLAEVYRALGDFERAAPLFRRALGIDEKAFGAEHPRVAIRLNNLAELYRQQGDYAQAQQLLQRALGIEEKAAAIRETAPENVAIRYNNLAQLYRTVGHYARAEPLYREALEIWEQTPGPDSPLTAVALNNLGWLAHGRKEYAKAEGFYRRALRISEKTFGPEHPDVARNLNNLALLYADQGKRQEAAPLYARALQIWEKTYGPDHPAVAALLHNQAKLYREDGQLAEAEQALQRALAIAQSNEQPELLWAVQDNLSQLLRKQEQYDAAILVGKQAVNTLQKLRINLARMDKELQRSFAEDKRGVYQRLADLLMQQGRTSEAQQVLMMLKEEEYFDFVRRDGNVDTRAVQARYNDREQPWAERAAKLQARFAELGGALRALRLRPNLTPAQQASKADLAQAVQSAAGDLAAYLADLKRAFEKRQEEAAVQLAASGDDLKLAALGREFQELRGQDALSPEAQARKDELRKILFNAALNFNACLQEVKAQEQFQDKNLDTLRGLQGTLRELEHGAVLVHYLILPDKLRIILTTPDIQLCREAQVGEADLDQHITAFREQLSTAPHVVPKLRWQQQDALRAEARTLYDWMIQPIAEDLAQAGAETLMLSLDGRLRYVPVAALHDGERYLAERYALVMFTEAARDKLKDRPTPDWKVAGLGLSQAVPGFNPLPSVVKELQGIVRQDEADPDGVIPGFIKLNQEFTADGLLEALDRRYPVLHIASHFVFQPSTDQDSFLLLGDGSELSLAKIRVGYDFNGLDLISLSACQTAVGSETKGKEVEGFGALAQKQGAKSVLATLWPVDDRSTGLFMQHLYRVHTQHPELTKVQALRQAQNAFINARKVGPAQTAGDVPLYHRDYENPYYWAPFILMGNWL